MLGSNDPFVNAFGDDEDDDESDASALTLRTRTLRDHNNGVLSFHQGTEYALLAFVQQEIQKFSVADAMESSPKELYHDTSTNRKLTRRVLESIDQFCTERHWMMHVGPQKGCILQDFLKERIQNHVSRYQNERTFNVVELGTYCGYSTIRLVDTLLQFTTNFHVCTVDVNAQTQNVAKKLIALAGFERYVTFVLRNQSSLCDHSNPISFVEQLSEAMAGSMKNFDDSSLVKDPNGGSHRIPAPMINFLFVDHAKELYLSDVQLLANNHFIHRHTAIAADNVVFFQLTDYRQYMMSLQAMGIVQTKLISDGIFLEYSEATTEPSTTLDVCDGLELTVFLKDHFISKDC